MDAQDRPVRSRRWVRSRPVLVAVVVAGLVLGVSGWVSRSVLPSSGASAAAVGVAPGAPNPAVPPPDAAQQGFSVTSFGQGRATAAGLSVLVDQPRPFKPSPDATGVTSSRAVLVRTTITNGGAQPFAFDPFRFGPQATHAGVEATHIVDHRAHAGEVLPTTIQPGQSFSYDTALSVQPGRGSLELDYSASDSEDDAVVIVGVV